MGDKVLTIVATPARRSSKLRYLRAVGRCDEFVVMLPGLKEPQALANVARKLHKNLSAPIHALDETVRVGVSIGGTIGLPAGGDFDGLLQRADAAMYRAKARDSEYCFCEASSAAAA